MLDLVVETTEPGNSSPPFPVKEIERFTCLSLKEFQLRNATGLGFPEDGFKDF
jgi:hypothetical protein